MRQLALFPPLIFPSPADLCQAIVSARECPVEILHSLVTHRQEADPVLYEIALRHPHTPLQALLDAIHEGVGFVVRRVAQNHSLPTMVLADLASSPDPLIAEAARQTLAAREAGLVTGERIR